MSCFYRQTSRKRPWWSSGFSTFTSDNNINDDDGMTPETRHLAETLLSTPTDPSKATDSTAQPIVPWWEHRRALSQAITLVESTKTQDQQQALQLLQWVQMQPLAQQRLNSSLRIGLAGPPGAGKSTLVEALGMYVLQQQPEQPAPDSSSTISTSWTPDRVAVVCIDPSGQRGGSILGDKTRMVELSRHPKAYCRPAPTRGTLGGVAVATQEVITLCQVAGYPLVLLETVGLGQSEVDVAQVTDCNVLLIPPGGGDALQGVKKGILEIANLIVVTKADGTLLPAAKKTAADYQGALQFFNTVGPTMSNDDCGADRPQVLLVSSETGHGLDELWQHLVRFRHDNLSAIQSRRQSQNDYWMWKHVQNFLERQIHHDTRLKERAIAMHEALRKGQTTPRAAAKDLLDAWQQAGNGKD